MASELLTDKLEAANAVLKSFNRSQIEIRRGGYYVTWTGSRGIVSKRWCCRGQDFYPTWSRKWPGGGTASTALSQLIRWLRGQPVLSIHTWRYWASETCSLLPRAAVDELEAAGYPQQSICVLCGNQIDGGIDWWNLDGVSGPCCSWTNGCRQNIRKEPTND